jgi:hypothetical protein
LSADQANAYADELGLIPGNVQTIVDLQHQTAMANALAFAQKLAEIPNSKTVYLYIQEQRLAAGPATGPQIPFANGGLMTYANAVGNMYDSGFYSGSRGPLYKFAEPEVGWEAFISGKPGMEARNRGIALEAYKRLGGDMGGSGAVVNNYFNYTAQPIRDNDPHVAQTIWARDFARKVAG